MLSIHLLYLNCYILMTEGIMVQSMNTDGIKWNKKPNSLDEDFPDILTLDFSFIGRIRP